MNHTGFFDARRVALPTNPRFVDKTGKKFGRLTVAGYAGKRGNSNMWLAECECGNTVVVSGSNMATGNSASCGCIRKETTASLKYRHGGIGSDLYRHWQAMLTRCRNPNAQYYNCYGGRGITVCDEFLDFINYKNYIESAIGPKPTAGHSIDRIDNEIGYQRGNLRWATNHEQSINKRSTVMVQLFGEQLPLHEVSKIFCLEPYIVYQRVVKYKWALADALIMPVGKISKYHKWYRPTATEVNHAS